VAPADQASKRVTLVLLVPLRSTRLDDLYLSAEIVCDADDVRVPDTNRRWVDE
jgi:hypothetical protein